MRGGWKLSAQTKARMSAAQKGHFVSEIARERMRQAKLGKPLSSAHRENLLGHSHPGKPPTDAALRKFRKYRPTQVRQLRRLVATGMPIKHAAARLQINYQVAYQIVRGLSYVGRPHI